ncbi:unnamed protein product [Caretta caretta]
MHPICEVRQEPERGHATDSESCLSHTDFSASAAEESGVMEETSLTAIPEDFSETKRLEDKDFELGSVVPSWKGVLACILRNYTICQDRLEPTTRTAWGVIKETLPHPTAGIYKRKEEAKDKGSKRYSDMQKNLAQGKQVQM